MRINQRPMKCQNYSPERLVTPCYAQPKLDGLRAMYIDGHFYSGDGKRWNDNVVAHLLAPLKNRAKLSLDGEFYNHGWKLQQINKNIGVNRLEPTLLTLEISFHVFDTIIDNMSFEDRWLSVCVFFMNNSLMKKGIQAVPTLKVKNKFQADSYNETFVNTMGFEGTIYRMPRSYNSRFIDTGYLQGRAHWMLKRKDEDDAEFEIIDVQEGRMTDKGGKHVGRLGALLCKTKKGKTFHVGSGYSDAERTKLWKKRPIGQLLRVKYKCLSADGVPLEPRSLGIRDYA